MSCLLVISSEISLYTILYQLNRNTVVRCTFIAAHIAAACLLSKLIVNQALYFTFKFRSIEQHKIVFVYTLYYTQLWCSTSYPVQHNVTRTGMVSWLLTSTPPKRVTMSGQITCNLIFSRELLYIQEALQSVSIK